MSSGYDFNTHTRCALARMRIVAYVQKQKHALFTVQTKKFEEGRSWLFELGHPVGSCTQKRVMSDDDDDLSTDHRAAPSLRAMVIGDLQHLSIEALQQLLLKERAAHVRPRAVSNTG